MAGGAAAAMVAPTASLASGQPDPIFAMIVLHKKLLADLRGLCVQLDEAEFDATKEHGNCPIALILWLLWRDHHIGASEIDKCRETLLQARDRSGRGRDLDAKARCQAREDAELSWDERA